MVNTYLATGTRAYNGVKVASSVNGWANWTDLCKKKKLGHQLISYTRIKSKWIKDLNRSQDTIKVLADFCIGGKISDIPHSNIFAKISPRTREIK